MNNNRQRNASKHKIDNHNFKRKRCKEERLKKMDTFILMEDDKIMELHKTRRHMHQLGMESIINYVTTRIDEGDIDLVDNELHIICSFKRGTYKCNKQIPIARFEKCCPILKEKTDLLSKGLFKAYEKRNRVVYCPDAKCSGANGIILEQEPETNEVHCYCNKSWCRKCHESPYHEGTNCQMSKIGGLSEKDPNYKYLKENSQLCPRCGRFIQKDYGCDHMHCEPSLGGCGIYFCYVCGEELPSTYNKHVVYNEKIGTYVCPKRLDDKEKENIKGKAIIDPRFNFDPARQQPRNVNNQLHNDYNSDSESEYEEGVVHQLRPAERVPLNNPILRRQQRQRNIVRRVVHHPAINQARTISAVAERIATRIYLQ
jgi:hypothetical protein